MRFSLWRDPRPLTGVGVVAGVAVGFEVDWLLTRVQRRTARRNKPGTGLGKRVTATGGSDPGVAAKSRGGRHRGGGNPFQTLPKPVRPV